jgi:hypothetical protein
MVFDQTQTGTAVSYSVIPKAAIVPTSYPSPDTATNQLFSNFDRQRNLPPGRKPCLAELQSTHAGAWVRVLDLKGPCITSCLRCMRVRNFAESQRLPLRAANRAANLARITANGPRSKPSLRGVAPSGLPPILLLVSVVQPSCRTPKHNLSLSIANSPGSRHN